MHSMDSAHVYDAEEGHWSQPAPNTTTTTDQLFGDMGVMWNKPKTTYAVADNSKQPTPPPPVRDERHYIGRVGIAWLPVGILEIIMLGGCLAAWLNSDWTAVLCILVLIFVIGGCVAMQHYYIPSNDTRHKTPLFTINETAEDEI